MIPTVIPAIRSRIKRAKEYFSFQQESINALNGRKLLIFFCIHCTPTRITGWLRKERNDRDHTPFNRREAVIYQKNCRMWFI
ncbi:Uncharacterised protein [Moellerella wisconsensis]|nr:Uncharacterised protein [Moellerella wisconsensis]